MDIGELDVLLLRDGQKVTALESFVDSDGSCAYLVENEKNAVFNVSEKDVQEVVWRFSQPKNAVAKKRQAMPHIPPQTARLASHSV